MRNREPRLGPDSATFALLNRGKRSIAIDLKHPSARAHLTPLIETADVLVELFRPGVMDRLGLGYDAVRALNSRLIYCSLSGYGQSGSRAQLAGHDINIVGQLLATRGEYGYVVTDIGVAEPADVPPAVIEQLCDLPGTVRLRVC